MNDKHDLELTLQSRFPLIVIETHEEHRALDLLTRIARDQKRELQQWTITDGLRHLTYQSGGASLELVAPAQHDSTPDTEPATALRRIRERRLPGIYVFLDLHAQFEDPVIVRLIKEIALDHLVTEQTLVFISHELTLPESLSRYSARFELALPDKEQITGLLQEEARLWATKNGNNVKADPKAMGMLIQNLVGLTVTDIKRFLRSAIYDDGAITHADLPEIQKAKYDLIGQDGLISFEYDTARFSDVGGMKSLKAWLEKRRTHFIQPGNNHDVPRGIVLAGIQGGGKSLTAKAVAGVWGVPLLRLDFGVLYNKFFGETEKNIRKALQLAEAMSPCVLWIDEIEKGIATGDYDSGTSRRVLGTLLTWMAEANRGVFLVATANDIKSLPPELIRKGRLDEIFFIDLPSPETRREIFAIHLRKRDHDSRTYDLAQLSEHSDGFSGAEIEQAVVDACFSAAAEQQPLATGHILTALQNTRPLSVVMSEKIDHLRMWAQHRTVAAD